MFSEEIDNRPPGELRVAYYYCDASATASSVSSLNNSSPNKTTVIRSLCRKLAWHSTNTVARSARDFYEKFSPESHEPPQLRDWEGLLKDLLDDFKTPTILVIDALDECSRPDEVLKHLSSSVQSRSNLYLVCSSRPHVPVTTYFNSTLAEIDVTSGKKEPDMNVFIATTIKERRNSPETQDSIFCGSNRNCD